MPTPVVASSSKGKGKASEDEDEEDDVKMGDLSDSDDETQASAAQGGIVALKSDFKTSTKLEALKNALLAAREEDPTVKAVVFSQFTSFIDLIERLMNKERFKYVRSLVRDRIHR